MIADGKAQAFKVLDVMADDGHVADRLMAGLIANPELIVGMGKGDPFLKVNLHGNELHAIDLPEVPKAIRIDHRDNGASPSKYRIRITLVVKMQGEESL